MKCCDLMRLLFDEKLWKFLLAGAGLTVIGMVTMFVPYNLMGFGYWMSSLISYIIGGVLSYFINSRWVFTAGKRGQKAFALFAANVAVCYLISFSLSKIMMPHLCSLLFPEWRISLVDQISMLVGMCFYTGLNYLGQRFLVFFKKD